MPWACCYTSCSPSAPVRAGAAEAQDRRCPRFPARPAARSARPLRVRNRSIDPGLDALIARCLSHDPAGRPATAREMVAALRRLQAPIRRARRWVVAHAKAVAVAGVLVSAGTTYGAVEVAKMPSQAAIHKQKADDLYRDGKFLEATQEYAESLELKPEQADVKLALGRAHQKLGEVLYKDGKYDAAVANYNLALHLAQKDADLGTRDDNQPELHFARGRAYLKLGKLDAATWDFEQAKPKENGRVTACIGYCCSLRQLQHDAAERYRAAIASGYSSAGLHNDLARCLTRMGEYADAESEATAALEIAPACGRRSTIAAWPDSWNGRRPATQHWL